MSDSISTLPVIDWDLGTRLAGNKISLARDLLAFLIKNLRKDIFDINQAYKNNELQLLKSLVHKLHGATSYCGVPRLTNALANVNNALKQNIHFDTHLLELVELEAIRVIEKASQLGD